MLSAESDERHEAQRQDADGEPGDEGPDRRRAGERAQRQTLLVGPAVQHAIDEHRAADDRGRERVAGQQRDERGRRERPDREEPRVEERVADARGRGRPQITVMTTAATRRPTVTATGSTALPAISVVPMRVSPTSPASNAAPNQNAPTTSIRPGRRGVSQPADAAHPTNSATMPIGTLMKKTHRHDGANMSGPRSGETGRPRGRPRGGTRTRIAAPTNGPDGHPEERQRADDAERARPARPVEQVGRGRGPDRDQHAAADRLDEPGRDELVEALGEAGKHRPDDEDRRAPP